MGAPAGLDRPRPHMKVVDRTPMPPLGHFSMIRFRKSGCRRRNHRPARAVVSGTEGHMQAHHPRGIAVSLCCGRLRARRRRSRSCRRRAGRAQARSEGLPRPATGCGAATRSRTRAARRGRMRPERQARPHRGRDLSAARASIPISGRQRRRSQDSNMPVIPPPGQPGRRSGAAAEIRIGSEAAFRARLA